MPDIMDFSAGWHNKLEQPHGNLPIATLHSNLCLTKIKIKVTNNLIW